MPAKNFNRKKKLGGDGKNGLRSVGLTLEYGPKQDGLKLPPPKFHSNWHSIFPNGRVFLKVLFLHGEKAFKTAISSKYNNGEKNKYR